jgi:hypothetical protein
LGKIIILDNNKIKSLYLQGLFCREIGAKFGVGEWVIWKRLRKLGVPRRNRGFKEGHSCPKEMREKISVSHLREKNPNWKGSTTNKQTGYCRANSWFNPPKGKERHHIDGNPLNNSPENILFVARKEHMIMDGRLEKKRLELSKAICSLPSQLRKSKKEKVTNTVNGKYVESKDKAIQLKKEIKSIGHCACVSKQWHPNTSGWWVQECPNNSCKAKMQFISTA